MNKFARATIAAGAATLLLLGGAGSLAYWNDQADLKGGTINTGELSLTASDETWVPEIAAWVPGDASSYTTTLTLVAEGDNIQGEIVLNDDSVQVTPNAAADQFVIEFAPVDAGSLPAGITYEAAGQKFLFDGPDTYEIPVQVKVEFPFIEDAEQNSSQNTVVDLAGVSFTVTQTAADGAVTTP